MLQTLHEIWPEAPIFTSVYSPEVTPWTKGWDVRTSFLQCVPFAKNNHEMLGWLMPLAFESLDLSKFDVVISVTSEAAKGVLTNSRQLHICYLLTPTRYLWSHARDYLEMVPNITRPFIMAMQSKLRQWDFMAAQRPDHMIAISKLIQKRCQKFYRREAEVIYPPVALGRHPEQAKRVEGSSEAVYSGPAAAGSRFLDFARNDARDYFLVVSRLVPYKKIDLAIAACNELKVPLIIVGTGSDEKRLRQLAGSTIRFIGCLTDERLISYYQRAKALLMPQEEDFGLAGLEAQTYAVPAITFRHSGAAEYVRDGATGVCFEDQSVKSMIQAIKKLEVYETSSNWKFRKLHTTEFSVGSFKEKFRSTIEKLWKMHQ